jgi:hypothetical protein
MPILAQVQPHALMSLDVRRKGVLKQLLITNRPYCKVASFSLSDGQFAQMVAQDKFRIRLQHLATHAISLMRS